MYGQNWLVAYLHCACCYVYCVCMWYMSLHGVYRLSLLFFLRIFRWWRVAQESVTEDVVQGVPYAATSTSSYYGIRIINNLLGSDLVFHLRRSYDETSQHENGPEEPSSSRTYALIRYDLWSRALKWSVLMIFLHQIFVND